MAAATTTTPLPPDGRRQDRLRRLVHEYALVQWMLDNDAPDHDTQADSLAAELKKQSTHLKDVKAPWLKMLKTVRAIRYGSKPHQLAALTGPLADRARFALVDRSSGTTTVENWALDQPYVTHGDPA